LGENVKKQIPLCGSVEGEKRRKRRNLTNSCENARQHDDEKLRSIALSYRSRVTQALNIVNQFPLLLQLVLSDLMDVWRNCIEPVK
jgi:hypothetical protein